MIMLRGECHVVTTNTLTVVTSCCDEEDQKREGSEDVCLSVCLSAYLSVSPPTARGLVYIQLKHLYPEWDEWRFKLKFRLFLINITDMLYVHSYVCIYAIILSSLDWVWLFKTGYTVTLLLTEGGTRRNNKNVCSAASILLYLIWLFRHFQQFGKYTLSEACSYPNLHICLSANLPVRLSDREM